MLNNIFRAASKKIPKDKNQKILSRMYFSSFIVLAYAQLMLAVYYAVYVGRIEGRAYTVSALGESFFTSLKATVTHLFILPQIMLLQLSGTLGPLPFDFRYTFFGVYILLGFLFSWLLPYKLSSYYYAIGRVRAALTYAALPFIWFIVIMFLHYIDANCFKTFDHIWKYQAGCEKLADLYYGILAFLSIIVLGLIPAFIYARTLFKRRFYFRGVLMIIISLAYALALPVGYTMIGLMTM